jgi:hypothetical protein
VTLLNKKGSSLNISASAIETFNRCRRKWYFGYVDRIRGPKNAAAARGDKIHDLAERYLKGEVTVETMSDEDKRWWRQLEPGLEFAPTPAEVIADGWGVEDWVKEVCGPLNFVGKVDIYHAESFTISDWKTTGNKGWRYSKSPEQLRNHIQPRVYAYALFKDNPPATVRFQHINMQSQGTPGAMEVWAEDVPWQEILDTWKDVVKVSGQMAAVATSHQEANDVSPNTKACRDFGGCEHAAICAASPQNRTAVLRNQAYTGPAPTMTTQNEDVAARRAALLASMGIAAPTKAPTITPKPTPPAEAPVENTTAQVRKVLESLGRVPDAVMQALAPGQVAEVAAELSLVLESGQWEVATALEAPAAVWEAGTPVRQWDGPVPAGAKVVAGLLVPEDYAGGAIEASREFGPAKQAAVAKVLETVPGPPPVQARPEAPPAPTGPDLDTRKAARAIIEAVKEGESLDLGDAKDACKAITSWKRIGHKRWAEVANAANAWLEEQGATWQVVFDDGFSRTGAAAPAPEPEPPEAIAPVADTKAPAVQESFEDGFKAGYDKCFEDKKGDFADGLEAGRQEGFLEGLHTGKQEGYDEGLAEAVAESAAPRPIVLIDAIPMTGEYVDFANWVAKFSDLVEAQNGVEHYGLIGYNQGPKAVAAEVKRALHAQGPDALPTTLYVNSSHPLAQEVIPLFTRLGAAVTIVKAVR